MAFEKGKALIAEVNEAEYAHNRIIQEGAEFYDEDELEVREDEAYEAYWKAVDTLADYLREVLPTIDRLTARKMAVVKRKEIMTLFSRAK